MDSGEGLAAPCTPPLGAVSPVSLSPPAAATPFAAPPVAAPALATPVAASSAPVALAASAGAAGDSPAGDEAAAGKGQTNRSKCWSCKKKTGLTGFECRCGYVFCAKHRYGEEHGCTFDYKALARTHLTADNQRVVAEKLERL